MIAGIKAQGWGYGRYSVFLNTTGDTMTYIPPTPFEGDDEPFTRETASLAMREILKHVIQYLGMQPTDEWPPSKVPIDVYLEAPSQLFHDDPTYVVMDITVRFSAGISYEAYNHDPDQENVFYSRDRGSDQYKTVFRAKVYKPSEVHRLKAHLNHLLDEQFDE